MVLLHDYGKIMAQTHSALQLPSQCLVVYENFKNSVL